MTRHKSRVARRSRHRARRGTRKQSGGWTFGPKPADAAPGAPPTGAPPVAEPAAAPADAPASPGDKNSWWHSILGLFKGNTNGPQLGGRKTRHRRRRRSPRRHRK